MTGEEFRRLRKQNGLTMRACAGQLGRSLSTVQRWELGKTRIPSSAAEQLARLAQPAVVNDTMHSIQRAHAQLELAHTAAQNGRPLEALSGLAGARSYTENAVADIISHLRETKTASWRTIGVKLGTTERTARERYAPLIGTAGARPGQRRSG